MKEIKFFSSDWGNQGSSTYSKNSKLPSIYEACSDYKSPGW